MRIIAAICFLLSFNSIFSQSSYALFFANDNYEENPKFKDLKNPIRDAEVLEKELREMYGFETKIYRNSSKSEIFNVLKQWQKKTFSKGEQLFIFFSGHGTFREFNKTGYFIPKTSKTDFEAYIDLKDLGNIVTNIKCKHILLAIDACYSGTILQEIAFRGTKHFNRPRALDKNQRNAFIEIQLRNKTRLVVTSGGKERTPDGDKHSPFSAAILKGLRECYLEEDGLLTYRELLVKLESVKPTPMHGKLFGDNQGGFVFINPNSNNISTSYKRLNDSEIISLADSLYNNGKYEEAIEQYSKIGNPIKLKSKTKYQIGLKFENNLSNKDRLRDAINWYELAAAAGEASSSREACKDIF